MNKKYKITTSKNIEYDESSKVETEDGIHFEVLGKSQGKGVIYFETPTDTKTCHCDILSANILSFKVDKTIVHLNSVINCEVEYDTVLSDDYIYPQLLINSDHFLIENNMTVNLNKIKFSIKCIKSTLTDISSNITIKDDVNNINTILTIVHYPEVKSIELNPNKIISDDVTDLIVNLSGPVQKFPDYIKVDYPENFEMTQRKIDNNKYIATFKAPENKSETKIFDFVVEWTSVDGSKKYLSTSLTQDPEEDLDDTVNNGFIFFPNNERAVFPRDIGRLDIRGSVVDKEALTGMGYILAYLTDDENNRNSIQTSQVVTRDWFVDAQVFHDDVDFSTAKYFRVYMRNLNDKVVGEKTFYFDDNVKIYLIDSLCYLNGKQKWMSDWLEVKTGETFTLNIPQTRDIEFPEDYKINVISGYNYRDNGFEVELLGHKLVKSLLHGDKLKDIELTLKANKSGDGRIIVGINDVYSTYLFVKIRD